MSTTEAEIVTTGGDQPQAPPAVPSTPAAEATPSTPEPKPDPKDLRAVITHATKTPSQRGQHAQFQPRQDQGKFAPGSPQIPPAPVAPPAQAAAPVKAQRPPMPKSLKADYQKNWEAIPEDHIPLLNAVIQRETDYEKGLQPLRTAKQQLDDLLNEFKPYELLLKAEGSTPKQAISNLLQTAALFRTGTPVQKAHAVAQLMGQFGVSFDHVQQVLSGNAPQAPLVQQQAVDPRIAQLEQRIEQFSQNQQRQDESRTIAAIQKFSADPANKHFDALQDRILALLQSPQIMGDDFGSKGDDEKLRLAYDYALRLDPQLYSQSIAEQQQAQTQQQVSRARQAAVQVTGAPTSTPASKPDPTNLRALLESQFAKQR